MDKKLPALGTVEALGPEGSSTFGNTSNATVLNGEQHTSGSRKYRRISLEYGAQPVRTSKFCWHSWTAHSICARFFPHTKVLTPGGYRLSTEVHEVPTGGRVIHVGNDVHLIGADGTVLYVTPNITMAVTPAVASASPEQSGGIRDLVAATGSHPVADEACGDRGLWLLQWLHLAH
ncbi:hypothetical protein K438DRAFT_1757796 [Mycena galopus ATCC 62051]|nr:hypothetical protein K438DRAFT_1757796 [Mycena galopus ATCC 62051]